MEGEAHSCIAGERDRESEQERDREGGRERGDGGREKERERGSTGGGGGGIKYTPISSQGHECYRSEAHQSTSIIEAPVRCLMTENVCHGK